MKREWESAHERWERQRKATLARMTAKRRAQYDAIVKLRDEIGPVDIDIVAALREIRDDRA